MKVDRIKSNINEAVNKKMKVDEESFFEGHSFVTYGREINSITIDAPILSIKKDTVVIKWSGKLELHNDGVYAFNIDVKSMVGDSEEESNSEVQSSPLNFNGFEFEVKKRKNPEVPEVQIFIDNVHVSTQEKKIYIEYII